MPQSSTTLLASGQRLQCDFIRDCKLSGLCYNGGTCVTVEEGGYYCQCPAEFTGLVCQDRVSQHFKYQTLDFNLND